MTDEEAETKLDLILIELDAQFGIEAGKAIIVYDDGNVYVTANLEPDDLARLLRSCAEKAESHDIGPISGPSGH